MEDLMLNVSFSSNDFAPLHDFGRDSLGRLYKAVFLPALTLVAVRPLDLPDYHRVATMIGACNRFPWYKLAESGNASTRIHSPKQEDGECAQQPSVECCPYLVGLYGTYFDSDKGTLNLVREYMNAGSIQMKVNDGVTFSIDDAAVLAYSILRALKAIHEHGIVHHEVKPGNMLVNTEGHIKLTSFGTIADFKQNITTGSAFLRALSYMAPQVINDGSDSNYETDLWSLGITMIVLLTGMHPYPQRNGLLPLVNAIMRGPQPALDHTGFPAELCDFVTACLNQPRGDSSCAARLLDHPFILAAKKRGALSDTTQAKLSIPCQRRLRSNLSPEMLAETIVNSVIERQLDHWAERMKIISEFTPFSDSCRLLTSQDKVTPDQQQWLAKQVGVSAEVIRDRFISKYDALEAVRGKSRCIAGLKKTLISSSALSWELELAVLSAPRRSNGPSSSRNNNDQRASGRDPPSLKVIRIQKDGMKHGQDPGQCMRLLPKPIPIHHHQHYKNKHKYTSRSALSVSKKEKVSSTLPTISEGNYETASEASADV